MTSSQDLEVYKAIVKSQTGTHFDIAMAIHAMYSNRFACVGVKPSRRIWYEKTSIDKPWKETSEVVIRNIMSHEVSRSYVKTAQWLYERAISEDGDLLKPHYITIANKLIKISMSLKNITFKNFIINQMSDVFQQQK
jgi:hypothetical protein